MKGYQLVLILTMNLSAWEMNTSVLSVVICFQVWQMPGLILMKCTPTVGWCSVNCVLLPIMTVKDFTNTWLES